MKASNWKWLLGMCVPVLIFGGLAAWLSRLQPQERARQATITSRKPLSLPVPTPSAQLEPGERFQIVIDQAVSRPATEYNASQGYNLIFELRVRARGDKPEWWGTPINRLVVKTKKEVKPSDCRIVAMVGAGNKERPLKTNFTVSTTYWDSADQTYHVRLSMNGNGVAQSEEVRWRGRTAIRDAFEPPLSSPVAFDVPIKLAGSTWDLPHFRQQSTVIIKNINIVVVTPERHEARVTATMPGGGLQVLYVKQFLDRQGHKLTFSPSLPVMQRLRLQVEQWSRNLSAASPIARDKNLPQDDDSRHAIFYWNPSQLRNAPRDVIVVAQTTAHKTWPLEFTFPIKRNGQILKGNVPVTSHPAPIQRD